MGKALRESLRTFAIFVCNYLRKPQSGGALLPKLMKVGFTRGIKSCRGAFIVFARSLTIASTTVLPSALLQTSYPNAPLNGVTH